MTGNNHPVFVPLVQNYLFAGVLLGPLEDKLPIPEQAGPDLFFFLMNLTSTGLILPLPFSSLVAAAL